MVNSAQWLFFFFVCVFVRLRVAGDLTRVDVPPLSDHCTIAWRTSLDVPLFDIAESPGELFR